MLFARWTRPGFRRALPADSAMITGNRSQAATRLRRTAHTMVGAARGGYGHGLAADLVSVKGETRAQRWSSCENLWKWIDAHGKEFGIGRPYLDKDAPHVGPIDGKEYADKRGRANAERAGSETNRRHRLAAHHDHSVTKHARTARSSRARNI